MRYSRLPLVELVEYCLSQEKEGDFWDFKQEWHEKIEDLIKDIVCFANTAHDEDCFLIFGVADDFSVTGMRKDRRKQADIIDTLSNLVFAGDNIPQVSLKTVKYIDEELDILIVHNTDKTPLYLKKPYGKMKSGCIYARVGDRNTSDNGNADIDTIEHLWRKRLGLTKTPIEYIFDALINKYDWAESQNGYYHIYKPEFTIERVNEDDFESGRGSDEFYSFAQTNESTSYYLLDIKAKGTVLERYQIVVLDSGRLSIPVPEWGFIHFDEYHQDTVGYKYYVRGSHTEELMRFMYDSQDAEQRWAFRNFEAVTLFFDSKIEKARFDKYIECNQHKLESRVKDSDAYDYIDTCNDVKTQGCKRSLRTAIVLKEMLEEFRGQNRSLSTCTTVGN